MAASAEGIIKIIIKGEDQTGGVFDKTFGRMQGLGKAAVLAGAGAAAAAGAAIGAVAVTGLKKFTEFEDGMNEVFTLLPEISGQAMDEMSSQVLDAAGEMGRMPDEIIPALYQSLSAGVPQDNVFEFLETAHQAALGGVTELETAVDGISSVVNAYGSDMISAGEASDLMFTAVRLGKTTFGELSSSLSNVTPLASAMGVSFGDVTAALAAMTSQGTPTAQATVQMRGLLQELGTAGTEVAGVFEDVAGKSFLEFVDEGGNVNQALQLLQQYANETGVPIQDLFGNVRAGLGALQLTGQGAETFASNLDAMAESAGATEAAYGRMNQGFARTVEVIKAKLETALIRVGDAIAPIARVIGEKLIGVLERLTPIIEGVAKSFGLFFTDLQNGADPLNALRSLFQRIVSYLPISESQFEEIGATIAGVFDFIQFTVIPTGQMLIDKIVEFGAPIVQAIAQFVSLKDILIAVGVFIGTFVVGAIISLITTLAPIIATVAAVIAIVALLRNAWENNWGGIQEKVTAVITFVRNLISSVMAGIQAFWAANGDAIMAKAQQIWTAIQTAISTAITTVQTIITTIVTAIQAFWTQHGETILAVANRIWTAIKTVIDTVIQNIKTIVDAFRSAFEGDWRAFGEKLREAWDRAWNLIKDAITTIVPQLISKAKELVTNIKNKFTEIDWGKVGGDIVRGIGNGISALGGWLADKAREIAQAALDAAKGFLGIESPSKVFAEVGKNVGMGLGEGIVSQTDLVEKRMKRMLETVSPDSIGIRAQFERSVPEFGAGSSNSFDRSRTVVNNFNLYLTTDGEAPPDILESFNRARTLVIE